MEWSARFRIRMMRGNGSLAVQLGKVFLAGLATLGQVSAAAAFASGSTGFATIRACPVQARLGGGSLSSIGDLITFVSKGRDVAKANVLPLFERVEYGGILPEAIALPMSAEDLIRDSASSDFGAMVDLKKSADAAWCHELRLRMWIRNASSRLLDIVGIAPNKKVLDRGYGSAIMFPPQGAAGGDVVRFECDLDKDAPSMRRFNLEGIKRKYTSAEYYFDEGVLEVEPCHAVCISILFHAEKNVYEVDPEIIVKLNGRVESIPVPADRRGVVCPSISIPDKGKMVRTFSGKPPFFENAPERFDAYLRY